MNDLKSSRYLAQFISQAEAQLDYRIDPERLLNKITDFWQGKIDETNAFFDKLDAANATPETVNPDYVRYHNFSMEAVFLGRKGMLEKHYAFMNEALQDMDMSSQQSKKVVTEFSAAIQQLMPLDHWNRLLKILHVKAIDDAGLHFEEAEVEIQKRWRVELKRMAFFLNPNLRHEVELNPHMFPELAIVLRQYRKQSEKAQPDDVREVDALRKKPLLRERLNDKTVALEDFRRMVVDLVELLGIQKNPQIISAISVMMQPGEMDEYVRDFVLQSIDAVSDKKKEV